MTTFDGSMSNVAQALSRLSSSELVERIQAVLARFTSESRLYDIHIDGTDAPLTVEAFSYTESVSSINEMNLLMLSTDAHLSAAAWLGQPCRLVTRLADGSETLTSGLIRAAQCVGAEAGLARYQITVVSWWWQLTQQSRCRVFQDKTVLQIVKELLAGYECGAWTQSDEVDAYVRELPGSLRPYTVQYRETDWDFLQRLLSECGLGVCAREREDAVAGVLHLFADSRQWPEDRSSQTNGGIRFHRSAATESTDTIQSFGQRWQLQTSSTTTLSYQPEFKRSVTGNGVSVALADGTPWQSGNEVTREHYRYSPRHASNAEAQQAVSLARQAAEAEASQWLGHATTRGLRAGTWFNLQQSMLLTMSDEPASRQFSVLGVQCIGINNLPKPAHQSLQALFGSATHTLHSLMEHQRDSGVWSQPLFEDTAVLTQSQRTGFGLRLQALDREQCWAAAPRHKPAAPGTLTARVTGPDGRLSADQADALWVDAQGRIQVRFHWQWGEQPDDTHTIWLRVQQPQAGAGMGWHLLPRIGHEVLVGFLQGDIDAPLVLSALYNGRGEAGVAPTPAGQQQAAQSVDTRMMAQSADHRPVAQGNLSGGQSPAWHGAGAATQRHAAALSGFKTAALHGSGGFNQLVLDDSDNELRIQLRSTHAGSELNLGHVIHQADNHRGSFRGAGVELRTDGHASLRAAQGVMLTTQALSPSSPAGEDVPGLGLARQLDTLLSTFSRAAQTHQATPLAAAQGSRRAQGSTLNDSAAPWPALHLSLKGMVSTTQFSNALQDAAQRRTQVDAAHVPHLADPLIVMTSQASHLSVTGQHHVDSVGDTLLVAAGEDHVCQQGGHYLRHTGQAISLLSGAIQPGPGNVSLQAIAAEDPLTIQAQSSTLAIRARQAVELKSQQALTVAAPKAIHLKTKAGARLSLINGHIEVHAPGTITVHRATLKQLGPERIDYSLIPFPHNMMKFNDRFQLLDPAGDPIANMRCEIIKEDGSKLTSVTDAQGHLPLLPDAMAVGVRVRVLEKVRS